MGSNLPPDWNSRRNTIYERDQYQCQNCGIQSGKNSNVELHAHHIVPKARGGSHKTSNLITLCKDCHHTVHSKTKKAPTTQDRSGPDFAELSDSILDSIVKMIHAGKELINFNIDENTQIREFRDRLSEGATELRSSSLTITEASTKLKKTDRHKYPDDIVTTTEAAIDAGIETLGPMLEAIEQISDSIDKAIEKELVCLKCDNKIKANDQFCSACGAEIDHLGRNDCRNCGTKIIVGQFTCPECGNTPDTDFSKDQQKFLNDINEYGDKMEKSSEKFFEKLKERKKLIKIHYN